MPIKEFLGKTGGILSAVPQSLRFLKPGYANVTLWIILFVIIEVGFVLTVQSHCFFDTKSGTSVCENKTLTGLPFLETSIILFAGAYIISSSIVQCYRKCFTRSYLK